MAPRATVTSIKVRMYRHGFGDCFLLAYFVGKKRVGTMLIDCGIKLNTRSPEVPIEDVVADLRKTLTPRGSKRPQLDVLLATHEHWDHIAFFHPESSKKFFDDWDIGEVWLAWTENPKDQEAVAINSRLRNGAAALRVAAAALREAEASEQQQFAGLYDGVPVASARERFNTSMDDVLGFYGVSPLTSKSGIKYKPDGKISVNTEDAMRHVVALGKNGIRYLSPGATVDSRTVPAGVNIFVLGPPRSRKINQSNPTKSGQGHETYFGMDSGLAGFANGLLRAATPDDTSETARRDSTPFGPRVGIPVGKVADHEHLNHWLQRTYHKPEEKYRQIEHCWLDVAGQFALQLDGAINNTSLVLAIELAHSGKVLLFPGDAQVGSWLSWHDLAFHVKRGSKTESVTTEQLLNNTVLYKVSHHGSHNATVKDKGLEMMTHPDLVAMIPEKEKSYQGILYPPLMKRLAELCKGRVIVSADVEHPPERLVQDRPEGLSAKEWAEFKKAINVQPLYVEYTVQ